MKYYTITVNGNTYEVSVEENIGVTATAPAPAPVSAPVAPVQKAAPAPAKAPVATSAPTPKASSGTEGSIKISSPMPGKILSLKASLGQAINKGDVILILEAMKMENEIVATEAGTISSINVSAGQSVEAGDLLATLN